MINNIYPTQEVDYSVPGQNLEERTENALLDRTFNSRFLFKDISSRSGTGYESNIEKKLKTSNTEEDDSIKSISGNNVLTYDKSHITSMNLLLATKPNFYLFDKAIGSEGLYQKINEEISDEDVLKYLQSKGNTESSAIANDMEQNRNSYQNHFLRLHEKIELNELFKEYQRFCRENDLESTDQEKFFKDLNYSLDGIHPRHVEMSTDKSFYEFFDSSKLDDAKEEAHKKAMVAEYSFIYHTAQKLGFNLNFQALIDVHPFMKMELRSNKDSEWVSNFFYNFDEEYSEQDLKNAKKFYKIMGCGPVSGPKYHIQPHMYDDYDPKPPGPGSAPQEMRLRNRF